MNIVNLCCCVQWGDAEGGRVENAPLNVLQRVFPGNKVYSVFKGKSEVTNPYCLISGIYRCRRRDRLVQWGQQRVVGWKMQPSLY